MIEYFSYFETIKSPLDQGFSLEEIQLIETKLGKKFPAAYIAFLQTMGKYTSCFMGDDHSIYELETYHKDASTALNSPHFLTENHIVFISSQACNWYCFSLLEGENPPVYFIQEGQLGLEPLIKYESFTLFITQHVL